MIHEYKPSEGLKVQGTVKVRLPKYTERLQYLRDCQFKINGDGDIEIDSGMIDSTIKMIQIAEKHVESVDLALESGKEIKSFEEMEYFPECEPVLQELGNLMLSGVQVGNG